MDDSLLIEKKDDISLVLCGRAGQGIQSVEHLLTRVFKLAGYHVFATKEYMSRIRGGMNSTQIRVSSRPVRAAVSRIDILVPLDRGAVGHVEKRIFPGTVILADRQAIGDDFDRAGHSFVHVPFTETASEIGDKIYSNVVAVGTIAALLAIDLQTVTRFVEKFFSTKSGDIVRKNLIAVKQGFTLGTDLVDSGRIRIEIAKDADLESRILLKGVEAVALGAIAGGCDFISSYPMSPATGVLAFLAGQAKDFGIIAEQAEGEIAAMNMAIGAWYAGARAMVTTSGGGFALMSEGLSLAGMIESPMVIHLAQRPGPATGLPTRTEQGDFELALYSGHGEFPRVIFAPGKIEDAFYLTRRAFDLADKYQVPVFVLTDQYLMDSYYDTDSFDLSEITVEKHIIETDAAYKRYALTAGGVSPRGIPGFGQGLVAVDSDEHDEAGHITEDLALRTDMVDKRLRKLRPLQYEIVPPELVGPEDYKHLVVCWGSTYHIVREAIENLGRNDVASLHFRQVYPLPNETIDYLLKARRTVIVENNATSQFAKLIKLHTGIDMDDKFLKYDGLSFTVEELTEGLDDLLS
ncbi:MAG: 2-oxoacid:acceptor oxidoreductase subunit alpha [Planctomycetota bacterium]|jgi:2-oxoglutarate ferredoxin oxidoreductase subunit alpha